MKIIKIIFWILWRIWFYLMMGVPIIIMFPFLVVSILKEEWYRYFFVMARIWAKFILITSGFYWKVKSEQDIAMDKSYMFVGNHTSMTDIMLMLAVVKKPFVFLVESNQFTLGNKDSFCSFYFAGNSVFYRAS